jgi:hypothetical protein
MSNTPASQIVLIRHAEKPAEPAPPHGVSLDGQPDVESLTVRGWQRAGALACLFAPPFGAHRGKGLGQPRYLYASNPRKHRSKRSRQTLSPLARKLGLEINSDFSPGEEEELARDARSRSGVVLVCWRHQHLPAIAHHLLGDRTTAPQRWSEDRYDLIWVLDFDRATDQYRFSQLGQGLLHGDSPIITPGEGQVE